MRLLGKIAVCWLLAAFLVVYSPVVLTIIAAVWFFRVGFDRPKRTANRRTR